MSQVWIIELTVFRLRCQAELWTSRNEASSQTMLERVICASTLPLLRNWIIHRHCAIVSAHNPRTRSCAHCPDPGDRRRPISTRSVQQPRRQSSDDVAFITGRRCNTIPLNDRSQWVEQLDCERCGAPESTIAHLSRRSRHCPGGAIWTGHYVDVRCCMRAVRAVH